MRTKLLQFDSDWKTIRKIHFHSYRRKTMAWILSCIMMVTIAFGGIIVFADSQILDTDVSTPSEGCVFAGLAGTYYAEGQAALDRINEIRMEACTAGNVPDPRNPSRMLTNSDYIPIKWSADLERIARIRAYESAVSMSHQRLNGKSIWELSSNGIQSKGEVLAFSRRTGMIVGIDIWYEEKSDWLSQNSDAVTGHYTQMIDPSHTYVGLGCFCSPQTKFYSTTAGEFLRSNSELDTSMLEVPEGNVIQKIEVMLSAISNYQLFSDRMEIQVGETEGLELSAQVDFSGNSTSLLILDGSEYQSTNPQVVSVSEDGLMTAKNPGETMINAIVDGTVVASLKIVVESSDQTAVVTVSALGKGSVSGGGTFVKGSSVSVKATPESNQDFLGWYIADQLISQELEYTFTVEEDTDLVGKFSSKSIAGWKENSTGRWFVNDDGTYVKNTWKKIDGKWYHFDSKGYMQTGWLKLNGIWYYLQSDGVMVIGWLKIGSAWYYFNNNGSMACETWVGDYYLTSSGKMATSTWIGNKYVDSSGKWDPTKVKEGWIQNSTGWWYRNADGSYPKNAWKKIDGKWYHFDSKGYRQTGWLKLNNTWYYLQSDGVMATGWLKVGSYYYYFNSNGSMAKDTWIGNYYVDSSGRWVKDAGK